MNSQFRGFIVNKNDLWPRDGQQAQGHCAAIVVGVRNDRMVAELDGRIWLTAMFLLTSHDKCFYNYFYCFIKT